MYLLKEIFSNPNSNYDFFNFLGIILSCIVSVLIFHAKPASAFIKERHDNLIFPLFNTLEAALYREIDTTILNNALKIIEENKQLVDGKLLKINYLCRTNPTQENFIALCSYIDEAYDKSCEALHLSLRPFEYRYVRKQYKNKFTLCVYIGKCFFIHTIYWIVFLLLLAFLLNLYLLIFDILNNIERFLLFLGILAFCYFALKRLRFPN